jgi:hypothetical protein
VYCSKLWLSHKSMLCLYCVLGNNSRINLCKITTILICWNNLQVLLNRRAGTTADGKKYNCFDIKFWRNQDCHISLKHWLGVDVVCFMPIFGGKNGIFLLNQCYNIFPKTSRSLS